MRSRDQEDPEATGVFGPQIRNENTLFLAENVESTTPPGPRESFILLYDRLAELARVTKNPGFVIGAIGKDMRVAGTEVIPVKSTVSIGRHTKCRIRLPADNVSLRHVVALILEEEPGIPTIRLWDLNTREPFSTEDGKKNCAVVSDGATYLAIGSFAIWCIPCGNGKQWPDRASVAWDQMPSRSFIDQRAPVPSNRRGGVNALPPPLQRKGGPYRGHEDNSRITTLAPPLLLGDDEEPELAWATIRLQSRNAKAKRSVSAERLGQGLLIGRYERCGLSLGDIDKNVSRVHILLVRIGSDVWAIDTGSTNGVRREGKNIDALILQDVDRLEFGSNMTLDWAKLEHAEA